MHYARSAVPQATSGFGPSSAKLGWHEEEYERFRDELLTRGVLVRGRGRGGSVALAEPGNLELPLDLPNAAPSARSRRRDEDGLRKPRSIYFCNFSRDPSSLHEFSFTALGRTSEPDIGAPSYILLQTSSGTVLLGKIKRTRKVATIGKALDLSEVRQVLLDSELRKKWTAQHHVTLPIEKDEVMDLSAIFDVVKADLLRLNSDLTEDYFSFRVFSPDSDIPVQFGDAVASGLRIFFPREPPLNRNYKNLHEQNILLLDIQTFIEGPIMVDPHGRVRFVSGERELIIHKVDSDELERCLGIDLVYNYRDEERCVFIQYKCQKNNGRPYYFSSDDRIKGQVERMRRIPGIDSCPNLSRRLSDARLCGCSAFVKVCRREIHMHHNIPQGAYFPLCVWRQLMADPGQAGVHVRVRPHLSNEVFTECVRGGTIGTSADQTRYLHDWLYKPTEDERVRLIFEERLL